MLLFLFERRRGALGGGGGGSRSLGSCFRGREALVVPLRFRWGSRCGLFLLDSAGETWVRFFLEREDERKKESEGFFVLNDCCRRRRKSGAHRSRRKEEKNGANFFRELKIEEKKNSLSRSITPRASASLDAHRASRSAVTAAAAASLAASSADAN